MVDWLQKGRTHPKIAPHGQELEVFIIHNRPAHVALMVRRLSSIMNLTSSHPFWSVKNGLPANYPSLQRNVSCDAVVIGGGITGALVAVHLAEAGVKTLVLDKRDIGTGSTSASTALLQYEIDVPLRELIKKVGPVAATRSYQLCRDAIGKLEQLVARLKIHCGFERKPSLFLARHQREIPELREEFQLRRKMGIELEFYDASAVRARFPFSRPAALFSKDGGQVDPHRLTHGLLAAGKRAGLEVSTAQRWRVWRKPVAEFASPRTMVAGSPPAGP